jgi:hypothetical protein
MYIKLASLISKCLISALKLLRPRFGIKDAKPLIGHGVIKHGLSVKNVSELCPNFRGHPLPRWTKQGVSDTICQLKTTRKTPWDAWNTT